MFELADLVLNQVSFLIQMLINLSLHFVINARWNDGFRVSLFQLEDERLRVITLIGDDVIGTQGFDQRSGLREVAIVRRPLRSSAKHCPKRRLPSESWWRSRPDFGLDFVRRVFLCASSSTRMSAHNGRVNQQIFHVAVRRKMLAPTFQRP